MVIKRKSPALTAISNGATHSKYKLCNFTTKILECAVDTIFMAALGVGFAKGIVGASGNSPPDHEINIQVVGGCHDQ